MLLRLCLVVPLGLIIGAEAFVVSPSFLCQHHALKNYRLFQRRELQDDGGPSSLVQNRTDEVELRARARVRKSKQEEPKDEHVLTDLMDEKEQEAVLDEDAALRIMSSELTVKKFIGQDTTVNVPPLDIIFDRTLDTLEDALVHAHRIPYDVGWISDEIPQPDTRPVIVVLGSGWAAHAFLKIADTFKLRIIVVSPSNHFVFTPMLASAAVGSVEYRSMTEAIRVANPQIANYIEGTAMDVNVDEKYVTVQLKSVLEDVAVGDPPIITIPYDTLLVAVGSQVNDKIVRGAPEHSLRLKSCDDARRLRTAVGECFEYASRPDVQDTETKDCKEERRRRLTFVIVGGGPTGVELAGELCDFCRDITTPRVGAYPTMGDEYRVILVHGGPDLVPQFDPSLRDHALEALTKRGVEVRLNTRVLEVGDRKVKLSSKKDGEEEEMQVGLTVWAAGTRPVPFVDILLDKLPESARGVGGRVEVDKWMRCPTHKPETFGSIMMLGDAASFREKDDDEETLPETAQVAGQQGAYAARLLCRGYDMTVTPPKMQSSSSSSSSSRSAVNATDSQLEALVSTWVKLRGLETAPPFSFLNLGLLAYVGGGEALTQVEIGDVPVFSYAGSVAFLLWRSVYLVKQVATRNRVLVTFDWLKTYLFGRDITRL